MLVAIALTASLSLAGEPRVRAGVMRRVRIAQTKIASKPTPTAKLRVPFLKQEHALSCEVATLRMALAYRGVTVSEAELLAAVGFDPAPRTGNVLVGRAPRNSEGAKWGDPDEAFVGDVDGIMSKTGYGVHAGPIGRIAGRYRTAEVIENGTAASLTDAIANGNPVITWGHLGGGKPLRWRTLGGKEVRAVDGEHTRVVIGYNGTREDPAGFFVIDPIYGEQYWKTEKFVANWEPLGRTGVVIY
ncbi:C39 family peptidase [Candidatus Uhrbacteria bacterium]|nr:C39 family peptidase [Candidatus Uhrbacteria bacterium]